MKRVRGPEKIFEVSTKQQVFCNLLAALPEEKWTEPWINRVIKSAGYGKKSKTVLLSKPKLFDLARYIQKELPYQIKKIDNLIPNNPKPKWTFQQETFAQEIAADPMRNVKIAAERAGYDNPNYGYDLITRQSVVDRIKEIQKERRIKFQPSIDNLVQKLFIEANSNMADFVKEFDGDDVTFRDSDDIPRDQMGCISSIKRVVKGAGRDVSVSMGLKLKDSSKAQTLLFKYLGLGIEGTNTDPREFIQEVIEFSKNVSETEAFPMESIPKMEAPKSEETIQEERQASIVQPTTPAIESDKKTEIIKERVRVLTTKKTGTEE